MRIFLRLMMLTAFFMLITGCTETKNSVKDTGPGNDLTQDIAGDTTAPGEDVGWRDIVDVPDYGHDICGPGEDVQSAEDVGWCDIVPEDIQPGFDTCDDVNGCQDTHVNDPGTTDSGIKDVIVDIPPGPRAGECKSSQDCGGHDCVNLTKIDFHVCLHDMPSKATECKNFNIDECCSLMDCTDPYPGCYYMNHINFYGGMQMQKHNICVSDECMHDNDCDKKDNDGNAVPGLCLPAGVNGWPKTRCVTDYCARFGGCGAGEYCRVMLAPCASGYYIGSFCASPNTCETNKDCKNGEQCIGDVKTGKTICQMVYCPA